MRICHLPQNAFTTTLQIVKYLPPYTQTKKKKKNSSWPVEKHNLNPVRCSDSAVGSDRSLNMAWRQSLPTHYRNQFRLDTPTDRSAITHSAQHTCKSCLHTLFNPTRTCPSSVNDMIVQKWRAYKSCSLYAGALNLDVGISFRPIRLKGVIAKFVYVRFWCILCSSYKYITLNAIRGRKVNLICQMLTWINKTYCMGFADSSI